MSMQLKSAYRQFREEGFIVFPQIFKGKELERLLEACNTVPGFLDGLSSRAVAYFQQFIEKNRAGWTTYKE